MSKNSPSQSPSLLPPNYRASGVLLHVSSLPSPYGIGDLGPGAITWLDRLAAAGQRWWQILPLGPTGMANSPYDPLSTFAGNLHLLSPEWMIEDGLIGADDCPPADRSADRVDFEYVRATKPRLVEIACANFQNHRSGPLRDEYELFLAEQGHWVNDFAMFVAIKEQQGGVSFYDWPEELSRRDAAALENAKRQLASRIERARFGQFLFFHQWRRLKRHADDRNIQILGDVPFFVSPDSSEVWAHPELYLLDERKRPKVVAGVPPDYFSETGQLWGNPVYNWDAMRRDDYRWWMERLRALLTLVDSVRLDHFRAFAAAWHIPAGAPTAESGQWVPGPGAEFFIQAQYTFGRLPFIAEDLGLITEDVRRLRDAFHLPGMRVLQFAFDGDPDNLFLPHMYDENTVAFTGTHDNDTTRGWFQSLPEKSRRVVREYYGKPELKVEKVAWELLATAWSSRAALAIAPLQDIFNLGTEARMNVPGQAAGNWAWRATDAMFEGDAFDRLGDLTAETHRLSKAPLAAAGGQ